jgi:drug/metabolite transporter (DMT)-like permease
LLTVALALAAVYVLWGSTAPAMKVAVASIPPWWMAGLRFATAGILLWTWCRVRGRPLPSRKHAAGAALSGVVLLVFGNAVFAWTLQYLPSGIDALVFALSPLWMALFGFILYRERLSRLAAIGLLVGLGGMVYLYSPSGAQHLPAVPTAIALGTSLVWGFGSMFQRRLDKSDLVQTSALQMLAAAAVLALMAEFSGERLTLAEFTPSAAAALAYLVVFGSIVGFSAYLWLMSHVSTTLGSTYSYVNPVVSLAIGIGLLHEPFSWLLVMGAGVILSGVALMVLAPKPDPVTFRGIFSLKRH